MGVLHLLLLVVVIFVEEVFKNFQKSTKWTNFVGGNVGTSFIVIRNQYILVVKILNSKKSTKWTNFVGGNVGTSIIVIREQYFLVVKI